MATYKVIQDVEAEDKLLGPLTLRQFMYAGITVFCLYLCFFVITKGAWFLVFPILPFALLAGFFAFPWTGEQPTELWALARVSFLFKSRKRIWDQSGVKELVTITAPKRIEQIYTDGLSQTEVRSRLKALAETIDSRGWAVKYPGTSYLSPAYSTVSASSDRLIDPATIPQEVPTLGNDPYADIFDPDGSPVGQQFDSMLTANAQAQHDRLLAQMQQPSPPAATPQSQSPAPDYWFMNQPDTSAVPVGNATFQGQVVTTPINNVSPPPAAPQIQQQTTDANENEDQLAEQLQKSQANAAMTKARMPTVLPLAEQQKLQATQTTPPKAVTPPTDPSILELAHNDDLNVATIARQAKKAQGEEAGDEVIISLH